MFLSEPPSTQGDLHFKVLGFPVRVSPLFWLVSVLLGWRGAEDSALNILIWVVAVFVSILVHELGHALAFRYYGFGARIVLYSLGGLAIREQGYRDSYGSASPYAQRQNDGWQQVFISLAGPVAGFLFAGAIVAWLFAANRTYYFGIIDLNIGRGSVIENENLWRLVSCLMYVNILWGLVNLLPVYPLDGGQMAREFFLMGNANQGIRRSLVLSIGTGAALAVIGILSGRFFIALMFGYLAYSSYTTLQTYLGRGGGGFGGGFGGGRGW